MALTIYENKGAAPSKVKVDRRVYENADGKLVEDGDPSAIKLYCSAGKFVNRADFIARGGVIDIVDEPEPESSKPKPKRKTKKGA